MRDIRYEDQYYDPQSPPDPDTTDAHGPGVDLPLPPTPYVIPPDIYDTNTPPPTTTTTRTPVDPGPQTTPQPYTSGTGGMSGGGGGGFAWPKFNAPTFQAPPAFQYDAFKAPEFSDIFKDPSYQGRRDEGLNAIEHSAAAKGLTRLPQTVKALGGWNQDFAAREYNNIFDRAAQTYDRNRANAADTYSMNYGVSRDVFDRNYQGARDMFDYNEWRPSQLTFEDMYRRWKANLDSQTQIAAAGIGR